MLILYSVLVSLLIIALMGEGFCIYEHRQISYKYKAIIKRICDFSCILLLCLISVVGCINAPNVNIYFLVIYVAIYFFVKEIYSTLITSRRDKAIKIRLQEYVEFKIKFNELFGYKNFKEEKEKYRTKWIETYINANHKQSIGIFLNNKRYYFELLCDEYVNSLDYIINQIYQYAKDIKTVEDLKSLEFVIITDNKLAEEYANNFIPHNKAKPIKNPIVYNDVYFNMFMLAGYIVGNSLINLISGWSTISLAEKFVNFIFGGLFTLPFITGLIGLIIIIVESYKKTTK